MLNNVVPLRSEFIKPLAQSRHYGLVLTLPRVVREILPCWTECLCCLLKIFCVIRYVVIEFGKLRLWN